LLPENYNKNEEEEEGEKEETPQLSYFYYLVSTTSAVEEEESYGCLTRLSSSLIENTKSLCIQFMKKINNAVNNCPSELKKLLQKSVKVGLGTGMVNNLSFLSSSLTINLTTFIL